jgi:hypothetical protein
MDPRIAEWLASGDTGSSSKAIMLWLSAGVKESEWGASTPSDPSDLGRCLRLLDRMPEWKARMPEMAGAGGLWPTFAERWSEIEASFLSECGGKLPAKDDYSWKAQKTYDLMRQVHDAAYAKDKPDFTEVRFTEGKLAGCSMRFSK